MSFQCLTVECHDQYLQDERTHALVRIRSSGNFSGYTVCAYAGGVRLVREVRVYLILNNLPGMGSSGERILG